MTVLKMCRIMFCGVSRPNLIRTLFVTLSDLLLNMYAKMFDIDKARSRDFAQDTYAAIIESVEKKIAGPFDDSFLADCAPLMTALLATRRGRRTKVNQAACSLWKSTFAHAQSLTYTAELRKVLKHLVKKRVINAPGFSMVSGGDTEMTSDTEDASFGTSPFTESQSSSRPRRSKKLGKAEHAEGDCGLCIPSKQEDSVSSQAGKKRSKSISNVADEAGTPKPKTAKKEEIAGVKSEPRPPRLDSKEKTAAASKSPKSEELTPLRCAPTPRTKRRMCMGLLDEDSIDYVPIVSSESAKKMKLTDRQREIFSEKRASNVTRKESSPSQKEEPAVVIASEAQKEPMETRARRASLEHPAKTEEPVEESTASPKRRSKMKLNFDQKAYDRLPRAVLWKALRGSGVPERLITVIKDMYEGSKAAIRTPHGVTRKVDITEDPLRTILYADDIALVADNQKELEEKVQLWQRALAYNGLRLNVESCGSSLSDSTTGKPSMKESSAEVQEVERVPDLPLEDSASLTDDVSSSEESVEQSGLGDEKVEDGKQPDSRRSRKKLTPTKYLGLKRREVSKSFDKDQKTPQEATPKKVRQTKKTPLKNMIGTDAEPKQGRQESQENNVEQADDMVALREIDEVLTAKEPGCASLDESLDEKDQEQETVAQTPEKESGTVTQTPEKQNEAPGIIAATPTIPFVQRIAGTPGILKKIDSPSTAERKLRRVHFGETMENAVSDAANAPTDELDKAKITDDLIPASPKATLKRATPRRPFFHLQTSVEQAPEPTAESMEVSEVISTVSMEHKDDSDVAVVVVAVNCEEEVELVERPPTPETAVEEVEDVTEAQNELEPVPVTTAVEEEKKKILENVKEAYRILEEAAAQGAGGNTQLRRAASKTVRALLDLVEWCDEAV
ncbi:unnamed protein product [Heligmosomoides polygyrus]|uniref:Reverse transcriptase domain-containing protein n=1 Tax=Heligmosomoides polygyrus TaxID=6339 RepID=A0A3P8A711_HELPZ|nr:unnamed protein product [Heligmosomoides polygyrus]